MKTGTAALDPNNPQHWSGHGLPGAFYMPDTPGPVKAPKPTPEQERRFQDWKADLARRGVLPPTGKKS